GLRLRLRRGRGAAPLGRCRARPALLTLALMAAASALLAVAASLASEPGLPLRAARWLAPGADPVAALSLAPPECLPPGSSRGGRRSLDIEVGRAAFRSPLLLGGQAARAGISCESCHRSGRG